MEYRIETLQETLLAGLNISMSFQDNKTALLWQRFMPVKMSFTNGKSDLLYSVEVYPTNFFTQPVDPNKQFEKWAGMLWRENDQLPENWEILTVPQGKYAVFIFQGKHELAAAFYQNIFMNWLPKASLIVDDRPHFALMDERYKMNDPESVEEIWIPVK